MVLHKIFFCLFLLFAALISDAQHSKLKLSMKFGITASILTNDVGPFDKSAPGYYDNGYKKYLRPSAMGGLGLCYTLSEKFSVSTELIFNTRGGAYRKPSSGVVIIGSQGTEKAYDYFKFVVDFVELPFIARYDLSNINSSTSFIIYGGFSPGIAINKRAVVTGYSGNNNSPIAEQVSNAEDLNYVRAFNLFPQAGFELGGKNSRKKHQFFADLRFSLSALSVFSQSEYPDGSNMNTRTGSAAFGVGVRF